MHIEFGGVAESGLRRLIPNQVGVPSFAATGSFVGSNPTISASLPGSKPGEVVQASETNGPGPNRVVCVLRNPVENSKRNDGIV